MPSCPTCGQNMIRADLFDPDGVVPLQDLVKIDEYPWACIAPHSRHLNFWQSRQPNINPDRSKEEVRT